MTARIVGAEESERVRLRAEGGPARRDNADVLDALLSGQMVHFDDEVSHFNRKALRVRYNLRLRLLSDGEGGRFYWTEPLDPAA